jgi:hypothetical protein
MGQSFKVAVKSVVTACQKADQNATARQIDIGQRAHIAVKIRTLQGVDAGSRRKLRAEATAEIVAQLVQARCAPQNFARTIAVGQVAILFGENDAKTLQLSSLVQFVRLVKRNPSKEEWSPKPKSEEPARALWAQVVSGDVQPSAVRAAVDNILGTKPKEPRAPKPKPNPAVEWARFAIGAEADVLGAALAAMANTDRPAFDRIARIIQTVAEKAEAPTIPTDKPTEKSAKGFISRRGRRAA